MFRQYFGRILKQLVGCVNLLKLIPFPFILGKSVFSLQSIIRDERIKNCLPLLISSIFDRFLYCFADNLHFVLDLELLNEIRKVLDIVLVIHLGELFENNELVDRRVNLLTTVSFEFPHFIRIDLDLFYAALEFLVCFVDATLVGLFAVPRYADGIENAVVERFSLLVGNVHIKF